MSWNHKSKKGIDNVSDNKLAPARPAQLRVIPEHYRELIKKPLRALPASVQPAALRLWTMHRHLAGLESPLSIASALSVWIEFHGLEPSDAIKVLDLLTAPGRMASHKFASDLMTAISAEVSTAITRRQQQREAAERRAFLHPTPEELEEELKMLKKLTETMGKI